MSDNTSFDREFRRRANQLRRTPAPRSWNRIEGRLDRRSQRGRLLHFRPWMIAAVLLLVAGVVLLADTGQTATEAILARQVQSVEELDAALPAPASSPTSPERIPEYLPGGEGQKMGTLMVSPKYRERT